MAGVVVGVVATGGVVVVGGGASTPTTSCSGVPASTALPPGMLWEMTRPTRGSPAGTVWFRMLSDRVVEPTIVDADDCRSPDTCGTVSVAGGPLTETLTG